jgi:HAD superfamily hydrolase (TIGR01549 family)
MIRGIVFDLDGTLVDSRLDFAAMRREMELPDGQPILEALAQLDPAHAERCHAILHQHELDGAERAVVLPGVAELLAILHSRGIRRAIATRNSRLITDATMRKLGLAADLVLTRDDGPVKPDPWAVIHACEQWQLSPSEVVVIGDYRFDVECAHSAGCRAVLLTHPHDPLAYANAEQANLLLRSLADHARLLAWLESL